MSDVALLALPVERFAAVLAPSVSAVSSVIVTPAVIARTATVREVVPVTTNSPIIIEWDYVASSTWSPAVTFASACQAGDLVVMWSVGYDYLGREPQVNSPISSGWTYLGGGPAYTDFQLHALVHVVTVGEAGSGVTFTATNFYNPMEGRSGKSIGVLVRNARTPAYLGYQENGDISPYGHIPTYPPYLAGLASNSQVEAGVLVSAILDYEARVVWNTVPAGWTEGVSPSNVWAGGRDARLVANTAVGLTQIIPTRAWPGWLETVYSLSVSVAIPTNSLTKTATPARIAKTATVRVPSVSTGTTVYPDVIAAVATIVDPYSLESDTLVTITPDTVDAVVEVPIADEPVRIDVSVLAATIWVTAIVLINTSPSSRPTFTGHGKDGYKPKMTPAERRDAFDQARKIHDLENP